MTHTYNFISGESIVLAKSKYRSFIDKCMDEESHAHLTPNADSSVYALCFAIFGYRLLLEDEILQRNKDAWDRQLRSDLEIMRANRQQVATLAFDKPYMQLLTFTLSALKILGTLDYNPLASAVKEVLPTNIETALKEARALEGTPRSGNQAMFIGILLLHAQQYLDTNTENAINKWVENHITAMNCFGFWGPDTSMSHLQFQNGYHQYELLEYLTIEGQFWQTAADNVALLADNEGHFAPYPGGGGCYDYDAIFILTSGSDVASKHARLLQRSANTILAEQNSDGGFCESLRIRPRSLNNTFRSAKHVINSSGKARWERLRSAITLLRPKHNRINTHWSSYSRHWNESDLWDSWFRMLAVARIDCALQPDNSNRWGFIDYPGIGFHPSLHKK